MNYYKIPLGNSLNQNFFSDIPIHGKNIRLYFKIRYNNIAEYFTMCIQDRNRNDLIRNIPLLCGEDLLEQYQYKNLGHACIVDLESRLDNPSKNTLNKFMLVWYVED